jgi:hypothetical protein
VWLAPCSQSRIIINYQEEKEIMAEKVKTTGASKEKGYLYYLDKNGDLARSKMARGKK